MNFFSSITKAPAHSLTLPPLKTNGTRLHGNRRSIEFRRRLLIRPQPDRMCLTNEA